MASVLAPIKLLQGERATLQYQTTTFHLTSERADPGVLSLQIRSALSDPRLGLAP